MLGFLFSPLGKALGGFLAVAAIVTGIYTYAYQRGATAERTAILERSVEVLRERNEIDDQIRNMDDSALCRALGGVPVGGSCQ